MEAVSGKQSFDKLVIEGNIPFDDFEKGLESSDKQDLQKILFYMNEVANNKPLPNTKFKDVTPQKDNVKEYEFKSGNLRVYAISKRGGKVIIIGGYKNKQKKDFVRFRSIKKQYLEESNIKIKKCNEKVGVIKK